MQHYIILQYPYETIQVALCAQGKILQTITLHKFNATALTIPHIQSLLTQFNLKLSDLSCMGVNVGPGPYNTLRALLTMANGIHFANNMPLISASALELLDKEYKNENNLILLHAFANHVFYRLHIDGKIKQGGCSISDLIKMIQHQNQPLHVLGNAASIHKELLTEQCKDLIFSKSIPAFNSIEMLSKVVYEKFIEKNIEQNYLKPIYFEELA